MTDASSYFADISYWLVLPANQAQLGYSLANMVERNLPTLAASVPPEFQHDSAAQAANTGFNQKATCDSYLLTKDGTSVQCYEYYNASNGGGPVQLGNLPWVAHNLWLQYRYTLNATLLRKIEHAPVLLRLGVQHVSLRHVYLCHVNEVIFKKYVLVVSF